MVIPGNIPTQLRVLDSSQQLYAPLFLASYPSSTHTLSLQILRKTLLFLYNATSSPFSKISSRFPDSPPQRSLPQPPFCTTPSAATFSFLSSAPPDGLRDPLLESSSTCQSPTAASKKARLIPYGH